MPNTKTYRKGLLLAAKALRRYIVRWKTQLEQSLGEAGYTLLVTVLDGLEELISFLIDIEDTPDN